MAVDFTPAREYLDFLVADAGREFKRHFVDKPIDDASFMNATCYLVPDVNGEFEKTDDFVFLTAGGYANGRYRLVPPDANAFSRPRDLPSAVSLEDAPLLAAGINDELASAWLAGPASRGVAIQGFGAEKSARLFRLLQELRRVVDFGVADRCVSSTITQEEDGRNIQYLNVFKLKAFMTESGAWNEVSEVTKNFEQLTARVRIDARTKYREHAQRLRDAKPQNSRESYTISKAAEELMKDYPVEFETIYKHLHGLW